jgi:predicted nucleic acid-binding protein
MKAVFVDTMGWFSLLDRRDAWHDKAKSRMAKLAKARTPLFTSDYVVDETATLLKVRHAKQAIHGFFETVESSQALTLTPVTSARFQQAKDFFLKHLDHSYSFTDVTSFVLMKELGIREALTHDEHFTEAGFVRLLA